MKFKIILTFLLFGTVFSMCACGNKKNKTENYQSTIASSNIEKQEKSKVESSNFTKGSSKVESSNFTKESSLQPFKENSITSTIASEDSYKEVIESLFETSETSEVSETTSIESNCEDSIIHESEYSVELSNENVLSEISYFEESFQVNEPSENQESIERLELSTESTELYVEPSIQEIDNSQENESFIEFIPQTWGLVITSCTTENGYQIDRDTYVQVLNINDDLQKVIINWYDTSTSINRDDIEIFTVDSENMLERLLMKRTAGIIYKKG